MAHVPDHCPALLGERSGTGEKVVGRERLVVNGRDLQRTIRRLVPPQAPVQLCVIVARQTLPFLLGPLPDGPSPSFGLLKADPPIPKARPFPDL